MGNITWRVFRLFLKPVFWLLKKLYRLIILPGYALTIKIRQRFKKLFGPAKNKFIYPFLAKPLVHIVIIVLVFAVTAVNLQASTVPSTGGQNSLLYTLVGGDELTLIEETSLQKSNAIPTSYYEPGFGISQTNSLTRPEHIAVATDVGMITTGGNAIAAQPSISGSMPISSGPSKIRTDVEKYKVQSGDTVSTIAGNFGLSVNTLLWANNLSTNDYIKPGQELLILPIDGVQHTVTKGDTLSKIASKYDVDENKIREYNKLDEDETLTIDESLLIPDGIPPRAAPSTLVQLPSLRQIGGVFQKPASSPQASNPNMIWPTTGRVITQYWSWTHTGLDVDDDRPGAPIYAVDSGVVEIAGWGTGYGIQALVNHQNGFKTRYAHMAKIYVSAGQRVSKGEVIGIIGTTGFSTGTHLHFEVYVNGVRKNPLLYVR